MTITLTPRSTDRENTLAMLPHCPLERPPGCPLHHQLSPGMFLQWAIYTVERTLATEPEDERARRLR